MHEFPATAGDPRAAGPPELYRRRYGDSEGAPEDL